MPCDERVVQALFRAIERAEKRVANDVHNELILEEEDITAYLAAMIACEVSKVRVTGATANTFAIVIPRRSSRKNFAREKTYGADLIIALNLHCGDDFIQKAISFQAKRKGFTVVDGQVEFKGKSLLDDLKNQLKKLRGWTSAAKGLFFYEDGKILVASSDDILNIENGKGISGIRLSAVIRNAAKCKDGDKHLNVKSIRELENLLVKKNVKTGVFIKARGKG